MYLLIPESNAIKIHVIKFTFHNVSINSTGSGPKKEPKTPFTFHNVSINSLASKSNILSVTSIYIP